MSSWKRTSKELPPVLEKVLGYDDKRGYSMASRYSEEDESAWCVNGVSCRAGPAKVHPPTWWMELPEAPE